jgi:hypothetical protein
LKQAGYLQIGLDHFALPGDEMAIALGEGKLRRHFQGYTTDASNILLGFGASAIGRLPQGYVQNEIHTRGYLESIASGRLATIRGYALTDDDRLRAGELVSIRTGPLECHERRRQAGTAVSDRPNRADRLSGGPRSSSNESEAAKCLSRLRRGGAARGHPSSAGRDTQPVGRRVDAPVDYPAEACRDWRRIERASLRPSRSDEFAGRHASALDRVAGWPRRSSGGAWRHGDGPEFWPIAHQQSSDCWPTSSSI